MESARTFLLILLAFLTFLLYNAWTEQHAPAKTNQAPIESSLGALEAQNPPADPASNLPVSSTTMDDIASQTPESQAKVQSEAVLKTQPVEVVTDTLKVLISPAGGNLVSAELLNFKDSLEKDAKPLNILENRDGRVFLALSGLYGTGAPDQDGKVVSYQSEKSHYQLEDGEDQVTVNLRWTNDQGVEYTKQLTFYRGQYLIETKYIVSNKGSERIANRMFTALKRDTLPVANQETSGFGMQSFVGPAYSTDQSKYEKYSFEDLSEEPLNIKTKGGWVAILQHYFVTAWVPETEETAENLIDTADKNLGKSGLAQIRITQDWQWIDPDQSATFSAKLYVGPKIQDDLEQIAEGLELTVDYGFLWWIGQPIFALLTFLQGFVINWGLAIICVTIAIKMLLYPLARAQYRSFAKMRLLQPKLTAMKERYGDDRQQFSMKMMELYKKEKVNPLGGCFPLLIQMPVFIALYWVLMESVELRHAPFMLWIDDLAVKDPYFVLPLLMGASMYLMQKMQPASPTMDPMQQKMLQMMPVFMTVFFVFFPAGLVLYWLMNNLISIAQQLYITNQFNKEQEAKTKK
ncbi:membrane protein insertase YidC [Aliikangiella sp. G2MR2-5]|uniref:membrane protein insertase YidC n=1 Tax=Aliikangiella sp. G2MR2-5 TaxID=2788943 RepID=UPI0018AB1933|nr:membrane protein insertase YidC [Aliikangiella sp. G2MR2-5]